MTLLLYVRCCALGFVCDEKKKRDWYRSQSRMAQRSVASRTRPDSTANCVIRTRVEHNESLMMTQIERIRVIIDISLPECR
jgi:hypothetical protein